MVMRVPGTRLAGTVMCETVSAIIDSRKNFHQGGIDE
mgnify:CR=1 FL=1